MAAALAAFWRSTRALRRTPGFALLATGMLALGIGANIAMFTIVNAVWLRPLPYAAPDRLVSIQESVPRLASISPTLPVNAYDFTEWRTRSRAFDGLALVATGGATVNVVGEPQRVSVQVVSANLFSVLGIRPLWGRVFAEGDDAPGHDRVVVLSHGFWTRAFGGDPSVVGRRVLLSGSPYDVIGVLPADVKVPRVSQLGAVAFGDEDADLWRPFVISPGDLVKMSEFDYGCLARMKPGVTARQAQADLDAIERDIARSAGAEGQLAAVVTPLGEQAAARSRDGVTMLVAAVGVVLLIVCVNLSSVLLTRATGRQREIAVRAALGANTGQLVRQGLAESLGLVLASTCVGLGLAWWALHAFLLTAPLGLPRLRDIHVDPGVLAFTAGLALATAAIIGSLPAWRSARSQPQDALRSSDRSSTENRRAGLVRRLLISVEVALSIACLIVAGLLLNSFVRLMQVDKGFDASHGVVVPVSIVGPKADSLDARIALTEELVSRIEALPGVVAAGVSNRLPLTGEGSNLGLYVESSSVPRDQGAVADYRCVTERYFAAMGIPVLAGRVMRVTDRGHLVGLVSSDTAARLWPGENPIGRHFRLGGADQPPVEIIGIVGTVHGTSLQKAPNLTVYVPLWQTFRPDLAVAVRTSGDPTAAGTPIRSIIRELLPGLPVPRIRALQELIDASVATRRFQLNVVLTFGAAALFLAAMGVYSVVAQSIVGRTREIGVRIALGAARRDVWRLVAREGLLPVGVGLAAGVIVGGVASRLVSRLLYSVTPFDIPTYVMVVGVMLIAAVLAAAAPSRRATRIDPLLALRES